MSPTAHLGIYDTLADWEVGDLLAELHTGRFTGTRVDVVSVAEASEPITTMGGVRMVPDALLADLDPPAVTCSSCPGATSGTPAVTATSTSARSSTGI